VTETEYNDRMSRPVVRRLEDDHPQAWATFLTERDSGAKVEIDEAMWWYWLEVLPPVYMRRRVTLADGTEKVVAFGFAEGTERITAFWREDKRYFCQLTNEIARGN
jgi:hypothetical protein